MDSLSLPKVGKTLGSNCLSIAGTDHNGCVTEETKPNSFGKGFAQAGGGAYAVQIDVSGIYIWYAYSFSRHPFQSVLLFAQQSKRFWSASLAYELLSPH
jgi:hypothetical protein